MPAPPSGSHPRLEIDTKPVGDSVYVVEVCDDLSGVGDRAFGKPDRPQPINVGGTHVARCPRELVRVVAQRPVHGAEFSFAIVRLDVADPIVVVDLSPEVVGVGLRSVVTGVDLGHHDREHLPLPAGQRRLAVHDLGV